MSASIIRRQPEQVGGLPSSVHPLLRRVLANRGINQPELLELSAKALPKPQLKGLEQAVSILIDAIKQQLKIIVVGDFDADGATSTALSVMSLKQLGSRNVDFLVPNRFDFGYGLSPQIVDVAAQHGAQVIMTVDNGISCIAGVERAKQLGIKVIVTDHHLPGDVLPNADAIVNPNQVDCPFPSKNLAGVGVAFYLMLAVRGQLRAENFFADQQIPEPNLAEYLDLVALGTVADVVKLDHVNRILVQQGLNRIRQGYCRPGIKALLDVADRNPQFLVSSDFGFALGPRLNAAGRLDDMTLGISCLMAQDYSNAIMLAARLDELNKERREIESGMQAEAMATLEKTQVDGSASGICLFDETWHQGVIGIVAGRIKEQYYRPTVVFAEGDNDELKGSCRSIPGFHIRDALEFIDTRQPGLVIKFGGHAMAAGLSIRKHDYAVFKQAFELAVSKLIEPECLQHCIYSDGGLDGNYLTTQVADLLKRAMPWGQAFPEPIFDDEFIVINERILKDKHLKLVLQHPSGLSYDAIWFNYDQSLWRAQQIHQVRVAYVLDTNTFRGKTSVQMMIRAMEVL
ncbi:single-stranded-DNA-specific exonuclease RecJ [Saccharobesus litoralis]|uniref:Single-stranded-DNA-specific exonuclease RecJ n=1 Tax=Saccharobesus litoralis TaxID=2172099 RepID=A0A2S0VUX4_9ALTE|nr:single-stranded-DNA-specific exonuclease RecJ [Saccharobesus litoralis]AWB67983.1 single-stranded-DNA-specific exonuclease RecJ [Saccharobesus litoralis]